MSAARDAASGRPARAAWALSATALFALLVVLVNFVSFRRYARWDFTRDHLYTLSDRTEQLLARLDTPVEIYLFMSMGEESFHDMKELLTRYRALSQEINVEFVDPDREPARFRLLAERFGVRALMTESGSTMADLAALVVSGDKRWSITREDLVSSDFGSLGEEGEPKVDVKSEQALSGAILQVTEGRTTRVCTTSGHGEWTVEGEGRSLYYLKEELKRENIELETIETRGKAEPAKGCDAVFVLGPQKAFSVDESKALDAYLSGGGNVLLALDPVVSGEAIVPSGLEGLTRARGIELDANVLVELDPERLLTASPLESALVTTFSDHPLTRPLRLMGAPVVMMETRTVSIAEGSDAEWLLRASDKGYGESSVAELLAGDDLVPSEGDVKPPLNLAALYEPPAPEGEAPDDDAEAPRGGRLVVVGDSNWLAPELQQAAEFTNLELFSAVTGYLTEREALISIAPRKVSMRSVVITEDGLFGVFLRAVVLMPLSVLILGLGVWWQRRS